MTQAGTRAAPSAAPVSAGAGRRCAMTSNDVVATAYDRRRLGGRASRGRRGSRRAIGVWSNQSDWHRKVAQAGIPGLVNDQHRV